MLCLFYLLQYSDPPFKVSTAVFVDIIQRMSLGLPEVQYVAQGHSTSSGPCLQQWWNERILTAGSCAVPYRRLSSSCVL